MRADEINLLKTCSLLGVIFSHALLPFTVPGGFWKLFAEQPSLIADRIASCLGLIIIPSFMLASGYLLARTLESKKRSFAEQLANRTKRLLIPWLCMTLFWLAPLYAFFDLPAYNRPAGLSLLQTYAAGLKGLFCDHLWFLLVLFWASVFWLAAFPLLKRIGSAGGLALAFAVSWLISRYGRDLTWYALWETAGPLIYVFLGIALWTCRERLDVFLKRRAAPVFAVTLLLYALFASRAELPQILYWIACCAGALLAYQASLYCSRRWYRGLRGNVFYRYFEDNAFRFYLFHIPGGLLIFKALDALTGLSPLPFVLLSFALNLVATTLIVRLVNALEAFVRNLPDKSGKK
ncbi:MAG: acyltransferase [Deltaproteobacteria bacterium]|jgi:surface polysaccharide O-acyltransferase-like enzyme|nr:acyltransferase [Deltaproteobacteria bacterium]